MAYDVPRGRVLVACDKKTKLSIIPMIVGIVNLSTVNPSESLRQTDQKTSNPPAINRKIQAIKNLLVHREKTIQSEQAKEKAPAEYSQ